MMRIKIKMREYTMKNIHMLIGGQFEWDGRSYSIDRVDTVDISGKCINGTLWSMEPERFLQFIRSGEYTITDKNESKS